MIDLGQARQPNAIEARSWRDLAVRAKVIGQGHGRNWTELKRRLKALREAAVFGVYNEGNVCVRLKDVCWRGVKALDQERYIAAFGDEMHRLADEVLVRCEGYSPPAPTINTRLRAE